MDFRHRNKRKQLFIRALVLVSILLSSKIGLALEGQDVVFTNNYANRSLEYYYYLPAQVGKNSSDSYPLLVMVPGLSGQGRALVNHEVKAFADKEGFVIIAPSFKFDEQNWASKTSYHYPAEWSGNALLKIVRAVKDKHNIRISKFYLFGHSAGAQFVLRFALWKPQLCAVCASHASGGFIKPKSPNRVKFLITIGKTDKTRLKQNQEFRDYARRYGIDVTYKEYNTGHGLVPGQFRDSLDFFARYHRRGKIRVTEKNKSAQTVQPSTLRSETPSKEVIVHLINGRKTQGMVKAMTDKTIVLAIQMGHVWGTISISRKKIKFIEEVKN